MCNVLEKISKYQKKGAVNLGKITIVGIKSAELNMRLAIFKKSSGYSNQNNR